MHPYATPLQQPRTAMVWVAVLLLVFAALAPTLTQAVGGVPSQSPAQVICTSTGETIIQVDDPSSQDDGPAMPHRHCVFCLQPADRDAPPLLPLPYHFLVQSGLQVPRVWQAFFYAYFVPLRPPPRGPPQ